jgi:hypothetical protein
MASLLQQAMLPMTVVGYALPGRIGSKFGHVRYAVESGSKFRALAAPPRALELIALPET